MELSIALMGPCQIRLDGQEVVGFQSNKARALLAYLAAEAGRAHSREALAGLLWPDYPNPSALTYLRNALSNLRQVIGDAQADPSYLIVARDTIQLNPHSNVRVDVHDFEERTGKACDSSAKINNLQSAIGLNRGTFLEGLICDSTAFEEWTLSWRERLERELREALERLAEGYAQQGDYRSSVDTARRALAMEPWDEEAHRLVMAGLAHNGQRGAALAQYETCKRVLRRELGAEPSAETYALAEHIRERQVGPEAEPQTPLVVKRGRLPTPLTSFIGRQRELSEIERLLGFPQDGNQPVSKARLLTLIGSGGCGKTRLAVAAARRLVEKGCYPHGAGWVDLSPISDPQLVAETTAAALGLSKSSSTPALLQLESYLREREILLVLDNSEHLIAATARMAESLLGACPGLQILATSREPLGVAGEVLWRAPSLALPEPQPGKKVSVDELRGYDAVCLFEERARAVAPGWSLEENAEGVLAICTRLDGIPLAIELAAARVRMMTIEQIQARLGDFFHLLVGGSRTILPRHQTLRACIDWSYNLLSSDERALLRQLSVFSGGWSLDAAERVEKDLVRQERNNEETLDLLTRLVDRSLVIVGRDNNRGTRYRLLDTIRQYAREKLVEAGEEYQALSRHLAFFRELAIQAEAELRGPDQIQWKDQLMAELDNLRAALEWSLLHNPHSAMRIAGALHWFWWGRGLKHEGLRWLERSLAADEALPAATSTGNPEYALARGWAINAYAWLLGQILHEYQSGKNYPTSSQRQEVNTRREKLLNEGLAIFKNLGKLGRLGFGQALVQLSKDLAQDEHGLAVLREEGDRFLIAECLTNMTTRALGKRDYNLAKRLIDEQRILREEIGDIEGIGFENLQMGDLAFANNDFQLARECWETALSIYHRINDPEYIGISCGKLSEIAYQQSDYLQALDFAEERLSIARELGEEWQIAAGLINKGKALISLNPVQASEYLRDALIIFLGMKNEEGIADSIETWAILAFTLGQYNQAARLLAAALHWFNDRYKSLSPSAYTWWSNQREALRSTLGDEVSAKAWAEGEAMTLEQAVQYMLKEMGITN
jgi:predicted ATPase/DNA-binding SARP family transcriptional activator